MKLFNMKNSDKTLYEILNEYLNPELNKFKLQNNCKNLPYNREVWFNDDAILISNEDFNEILANIDI